MPSRLRRYDVPGHIHFWTISCYRRLGFFYDDRMKRVVIDALRLLHSKFQVCLIGYVVMPDHFHGIIYPHAKGRDDPTGVSSLLNASKQHVGYYGKETLREHWRQYGQLWSQPLMRWAHNEFGQQSIFAPRGYDFNIDRHDTLLEKLDYCHKNPITRGLVSRAEDWPWSSYRYYELGDRSLLAMDWNGEWPIIW